MYEKQTWVTGDVITEEKLNHMEDGISTGGGIYSIEDVVYYDGEVTTTISNEYAEGQLDNVALPRYKDLDIVFNGANYVLPYDAMEEKWGEFDDGGNPVFTTFPLTLNEYGYIVTQQEGTFSLKIYSGSNVNFQEDVLPVMHLEASRVGVLDGGFVLNKTFVEIINAVVSGKMIYAYLRELSKCLYLVGWSNDSLGLLFLATGEQANPLTTMSFKANAPDDYPKTTGGIS